MQFLWQHWVVVLITLAIGFYLGRKTTVLQGTAIG